MQQSSNKAKIQLGARHHPSGMRVSCPSEGLPFADYVQQVQALLRRMHAGKDDLGKIVAGNSPFELLPLGDGCQGTVKRYKRGVLLVHGLIDSPHHMRHLAAFFQRNGFRVMALLLPGHGTQPGDLLNVHWQEWAKTVAYGADCLDAEVDELYLAGFSAGAALSVLQAGHDQRVRALFLFSPALEITARARWANLHKLYSWLLPRTAWVSVLPDRDLYKYESFCKNAAAQMYKLICALPEEPINIPVFAAASADDATVNPHATLRFMQRARHVCCKLVWYATSKLEQNKVEWVNSAVPELRILSSSHTAIVMSPEDVHYGAAGTYINCLHYLPHDPNGYETCLAPAQAAWFGEIQEQNLRHSPLRRLTYNPHYAALESSMHEFIGTLP